MAEDKLLLEIKDLKTYFYSEDGEARALDGVSYKIYQGKTLGLVGESGCGKSVSALSALRLIPIPPGKIVGGEILFRGENLLRKSEAQMRKIRGNHISMIFQEPMTSLNPVYKVGDQITEALTLHQGMTKEDARERAIEMLDKVRIPSPHLRVDEYPHQMSGGMRQRVMIAMALACDPDLLIADEPSTALDVTIQAQLIDLLIQLQDEFNMSILLITHDLGVVAELAHYVAVMYAGKIVEYGGAEELFDHPMHPYTNGLFDSLPQLHVGKQERLKVIPGIVPSPLDFPSGCRFRTRCKYAFDKCVAEPLLEEIRPGHLAACWKLEK